MRFFCRVDLLWPSGRSITLPPLPACVCVFFVGPICGQIPREDLALVWELPAAGKPVKKALSPSRAMVHLDRLLVYHGLSYVDAFVMEIPCIKGGEVRHVQAQRLIVNKSRRSGGGGGVLVLCMAVALTLLEPPQTPPYTKPKSISPLTGFQL